ncbi:hypothetical protein M899_0546 [Bacteriovorax sp. BSW11_IV]|nr:hypothetical protein M899_0546 [Bacteriovorax sp. BSW11_IV]
MSKKAPISEKMGTFVFQNISIKSHFFKSRLCLAIFIEN